MFSRFRHAPYIPLIVTHPGWRYHPAAKVALLVAVGIGAAHLFGPRPDELLLPLAAALLLLVLALRFSVILLAISIALVCVLAGGLLYGTRGASEPLLPREVAIDRVNVTGLLRGDPRPVTGGWEFRLEVEQMSLRSVAVAPETDLLVRLYDPRADRAGLPSEGDRVHLRGNLRTARRPFFPGERDYGAWLLSQNIVGTLQIGRLRDVWSLGPAPVGSIERLQRRFRASVRRYCGEAIGGEEGGIAYALLTGDRRDIDRDLRDAFSATGTAHVLALSGLHVGVIALALFVLLSWIPNRWVRFALFALVLGLYVVLTGASPSILRASLMATLFLLAYSIGRISHPLNTLGLAGLIILLIDPSSLFDVGFQLSFGAVGGIILFYGRLYRWIDRRLPLLTTSGPVRWVVSLFLLSVTAQLGTFPLIAYYFGHASLLSPLLNIAVVPLITVGFGATAAGLLISWVPGLPLWYGASASLALGWGIDLVTLGAGVDWQGISLPDLPALTVLALLCGIVWTGLARTAPSASVRFVSVGLLFVLLSLLLPSTGPPLDRFYLLPLSRTGGVVLLYHRGEELTVWFGDVRESDSARVAGIAARAAEHLEAGRVELVAITGPRPDRTDDRLLLLNGYGPEYLDRRVPVLLSNTATRPVDIVTIAGRPVLQVPLHAPIAPHTLPPP